MKKSKGFTLVELLAVVLILGILLLIGVMGIGRIITRTKSKSFVSSFNLIEKNIEERIDFESELVCDDTVETNKCSSLYDISANDYKMKVEYSADDGGYIVTLTGIGSFKNIELTNICPVSKACKDQTISVLIKTDGRVVAYVWEKRIIVGNWSGKFTGITNFKTKVESITFMRENKKIEGFVKDADLSENRDGRITGSIKDADGNGLYEVYIGCNDDIYISKTNSTGFFSGFTKLTTINGLENVNTSDMPSMYRMFYNCPKLTSIDLSSFNTEKVTNMEQMFQGDSSITTLDLSTFNTEKVTTMQQMFNGCSILKNIKFGNEFTSENVTSMFEMFRGCNNLEKVDLSTFNTQSLTKMKNMFFYCNKIKEIIFGRNFNTSEVTDMSGIFYDCYFLEKLDLSYFDTRNVTTMENMFYYCYALKEIKFSNLFNTKNVTSMNSMFINCNALEKLNLSSFDTSSLTQMTRMFEGCYELTEIIFGNKFNAHNVSNFIGIFTNCKKLETIDLSAFNTSNAISFQSMFRGCLKMKNIDVSGFITTNVTNIDGMFYDCAALESVDMSSFDFTNMSTNNLFNSYNSKIYVKDQTQKNLLKSKVSSLNIDNIIIK